MAGGPKTEFVFVKGKVMWFKHDQPDAMYQKWSHVMYPDESSLEKIRELQAEGVKNILKKDEDGYFISWSRPTSRTISGKVIGMAPPEVIDANGQSLRNVRVGNGSYATTKLEVYQHKTPGGGKAKAARWLSSRIDELVPFERDSLDKNELRAVKDLEEQPEPLF